MPLPAVAFRDQVHLAVFAEFNEIRKATGPELLVRPDGTLGKGAVRSEDGSIAVDHGGEHARSREPLADNPVDAFGGASELIRRRRLGKAPQQEVPERADPLDLDRSAACRRRDSCNATGAVAPRHRL